MPGRNNTAYLGLGGNLGDPRETMAKALQTLDARRDITLLSVSGLYRTPPWGKTDQPDFLNACAGLETSLSARGLLDACLFVERQLKRVRDEHWGPRIIDIDVLWHSDGPVDEDGLIVPHPRMAERAFVLVPLADIAPGLEIGGVAVSELAARSDRTGLEMMDDTGWWRKLGE